MNLATAPSSSENPFGPMRRWIVEHDDRRLFIVGYVGLSIFLSIGISLFWLVVLVALHFGLECVKKHAEGARPTGRLIAWAAWDVKFDLALLTVAFALLIYTHVGIGVAGLGGAGRLLAELGTRFSAASRGFLPFKDLVLALRIFCTRKLDRYENRRRRKIWKPKGTAQPDALRLAAHRYPWEAPWSAAERFAVAFIAINVLACVTAFFVGDTPPATLLTVLADELHPWPALRD